MLGGGYIPGFWAGGYFDALAYSISTPRALNIIILCELAGRPTKRVGRSVGRDANSASWRVGWPVGQMAHLAGGPEHMRLDIDAINQARETGSQVSAR